jgi:hypothetical protein
MSEIDSKITEIIYSKCGCTDSSIEAVSMVAALIAADRAGLVERIHELEQELNNRPSNIAHKDCNIKHFWSGNVPEFDGIKHFKDY